MDNTENKTLSYDPETDYNRWDHSTYDIVSKVAYLIGVPKRFFEKEAEPPKIDVYEALDRDKNARIIRHLCILRASIERNFGNISKELRFSFRSILSIPEYIPQDSIRQLTEDDVKFYKKSNTKLNQHVIELNRLISDRINNCKHIFPVWLNWDYIRDMFIMEDGLTEAGTKKAADVYFENRELYPYQIYFNWCNPYPYGNILYNDKKFVTLLYEWHNDYFAEYSRVSDAGAFVKNSIYSFIDEAQRVVMVVDCENADVYRFCATLRGLEAEITAKIRKIMLFDDVNTVNTWKLLSSYTSIPVEHIMTERVKRSKSLVDIELTAKTCMEHYKNNVDSFVLVSSDSDYFGLISSLPEARFLTMMEREKCGPDMKAALASNGIFYCFLEDFYAGNSDDIKRNALFHQIRNYLSDAIKLNANELFEKALTETRISMDSKEAMQFFDKHIRQMYLTMDEEGNISIELKK